MADYTKDDFFYTALMQQLHALDPTFLESLARNIESLQEKAYQGRLSEDEVCLIEEVRRLRSLL